MTDFLELARTRYSVRAYKSEPWTRFSKLPDWLQPVALVTPVYHGVEMARAIVVGVEPAVAPWISIVYLTALIVAGGLLSMRPLRTELKP